MQLALLKITVVISVANAESAVQQATEAHASMARAPNDPTDQLPPIVPVVKDAVNQLDLQSVLERLEGFMKLADLVAGVCVHRLADLWWYD